LLRIVGIVIFVALIAFSANRLLRLYRDGNLFDEYNSQRKSNVTLLVASVLSVGALVFFELTSIRSRQWRQYGFGSERSGQKEVVDGVKSTSIYSAPPTLEAWQGRRKHASKSRRKKH
jgi:hypothetical protein